MLTDEQLEFIPNEMVYLFQNLEKEVITDIAIKMQKAGVYTQTAVDQIAILQSMGYKQSHISKEIKKILYRDVKFQRYKALSTKEYKKRVNQLINNLIKEAYKENGIYIKNVSEMAWKYDKALYARAGQKLSKDIAYNQVIKAFVKRSADEVKDLTKSLGFKNMNGYIKLKNAYNLELDKAIIKLTTGSYTWSQVVQDATQSLAKDGIKRIYFESGAVREADTAVRNAVMTTSAQLSGEISDTNIKEMGVEHVEVSSHATARPSHASWQGKVYKYKDFVLACHYGDYGNPDAIYSYNCRHSHNAFWPGISERQAKPEPQPDVNYNGKTYTPYQATQHMRKQERDIRATKRQIYTKEATNESTIELKNKLKSQNSNYRDFCKSANTYPRTNRTLVVNQ